MPRRWLDYLQLARAPAVFTALSNILAAALLGGGPPAWGLVPLLGLASMALYAAGMVLNDCFDLEEDRRERPSRPLPSGRIALPVAWRLGFGLLAAGVLLAGLAGPLQFAIGLLLALAVAAYDGGAKNTPAGPAAMAACRYLNWLLGLSLDGLQAADFALALPVFLYVLALTFLSTVEARAHRRAPLSACGLGLWACAACVAGLHGAGLLPHHWALAPLAAALAWLLWRLRQTARDFTPASIQAMVKTLILGIIPLDALLAFSGGPWWGGVLVAGLWLPGWWLGRRMRVT